MFTLLITLAVAARPPVERDFTCEQVTMTDPGTELAVSGSIQPRRARPTYLAVEDADTSVVLVDRVSPRLNNLYDGGYWLTNYGLNTWPIGISGTTNYMFLVPAGSIGSTFSAELHEIFGPRGAWGWYPLEMDCTLL